LDSLTILAHGIENLALGVNDVIIPMIDARRMEVYTAIYNKDMTIEEDVHALILDEHSFINYKGIKHICGSGAEKFCLNYPKEDHKLHHRVTSAKYMNVLALLAFDQKIFSDVAYFTPQYFKAPNITKSTKKIF
jgi:tRNA threonylcarbamoyladenosine biosynthesis protein TsaB